MALVVGERKSEKNPSEDQKVEINMKLLRENHHWFRIFRKEEEEEEEEEKDPRGGPAATSQTRTR